MAYRPPMISATDAAVIERAYRLANKAMFTVALQVRRLDSLEPQDENFVFRKHADWEFLIASLYRLQRAAQIVTATERAVIEVIPALVQFSEAGSRTPAPNRASWTDRVGASDRRLDHLDRLAPEDLVRSPELVVMVMDEKAARIPSSSSSKTRFEPAGSPIRHEADRSPPASRSAGSPAPYRKGRRAASGIRYPR